MSADLTPYVERMRHNPQISAEVLDFFLSRREKYLFGAGAQAAVCLAMFRDMDLPVAGLLLGVTGDKEKLEGYWGRLLRKSPLYRLDAFPFPKDNCDILLTVDAARYAASEIHLRNMGFAHIYGCAWGSNMNIKNICLDLYQERLVTLQAIL
ncbi:hypothetical protein LJB81_02900 [Desulfovibrio sp. OttesenSCG-928-M14]|nr:hypothetical protein [Desulfovibrio sp. OttesenSCG-928-M14]